VALVCIRSAAYPRVVATSAQRSDMSESGSPPALHPGYDQCSEDRRDARFSPPGQQHRQATKTATGPQLHTYTACLTSAQCSMTNPARHGGHAWLLKEVAGQRGVPGWGYGSDPPSDLNPHRRCAETRQSVTARKRPAYSDPQRGRHKLRWARTRRRDYSGHSCRGLAGQVYISHGKWKSANDDG
jgi:hypothetical protein